MSTTQNAPALTDDRVYRDMLNATARAQKALAEAAVCPTSTPARVTFLRDAFLAAYRDAHEVTYWRLYAAKPHASRTFDVNLQGLGNWEVTIDEAFGSSAVYLDSTPGFDVQTDRTGIDRYRDLADGILQHGLRRALRIAL